MSADCAKPHLNALDLRLNAPAVEFVSQAAKDAYVTALGQAPSIFGIDFRKSRVSEIVQGLLVKISRQLGESVEESIKNFGIWYCNFRQDADSIPDTLWSTLIIELISNQRGSARPERVSEIGLKSIESSYKRILDDRDRINSEIKIALSLKNITSWDDALISHTPDDRNELADSLALTIDARSFRRFWEIIHLTLNATDLKAFKDWLNDRSGVVAPYIPTHDRGRR